MRKCQVGEGGVPAGFEFIILPVAVLILTPAEWPRSLFMWLLAFVIFVGCKELGDQTGDLYRQGKYADGVTKYVKAIIARLEKIRTFKLTA